MKKFQLTVNFILFMLFGMSQNSHDTLATTMAVKDCFNHSGNMPARKPFKYWKQITRSSDFGKTPLWKTSVSTYRQINDSVRINLSRTMHTGAPSYEKNGVQKTVITENADKSKIVWVGMKKKGTRFVNQSKTEVFTSPFSNTNIGYTWKGDNWIPIKKTVDSDSVEGQIRTNTRYTYKNGEWVFEKQRIEQINPLKNTSAMRYYDFDTLAKLWKLMFFRQKMFDENCKVIEDTIFSNLHDGAQQSFIWRAVKTDTGNMMVGEEVITRHDTVKYTHSLAKTGTWEKDSSYTYQIDYRYHDSLKVFIPANLMLKKSDTTAKSSEDIYSRWNRETGEWNPDSKSYRYTDSTGMTHAIFYNYDSEKKKWSEYSRNEQIDRDGFLPYYFRNKTYNYQLKRWVCTSYIRNIWR